MYTCPVCAEDKDDSDGRHTPCCRQQVCTDCITSGGKDAMVRYQDSQYICVYCMDPVTDAHGYDGILADQDINAILAAQAQQAQPVAQVTVDGQTLRSNAWLFGAYTHSPGCG